MEIKLPYGSGHITANIPDERLKGVLTPHLNEYKTEKLENNDVTQAEIVRQALQEPIVSAPLFRLAENKNKIVIISSDHTRPVPSRITMPIILEEIRKGNPEAEITILVATGFHRASTESELRAKYGDKIVEQEKIVVHNSRDNKSLQRAGTLPSGGELILNKLALEADLLIAEGFIEPHFFAGFSGGRKSVLPGIAAEETVLANHCAEFIDHQKARTGILADNPLHRDMLYAARQADLTFILNVVIDEEKKVINAFAGHPEKAHLEGCQFVSELAGVERKEADIVITTNGGYPLDQNIYQAVKGMTAAEATCKTGGVIIIAAECADGHGGESFYNTFVSSNSPREVMDKILARGRKETVADQWESQILARILLNHEVIMVTDTPREMVENMYMKWAASIDDAIDMAQQEINKENYEITVIPDGVAVIVE